ncbi:hypothetical protein E5P55_01070 [Candidatus Pinguicoccus supinus]|uniref:phenylalanine--tRNA ligase n=1 Tax=Candidatus Pinguicoccus supinus TaxID=2529394 RepID=A0A7T0FXX8_9BACT|nr:hypothetical protein E5P55_01070 [Candidatus Pinguicoccus supinus]
MYFLFNFADQLYRLLLILTYKILLSEHNLFKLKRLFFGKLCFFDFLLKNIKLINYSYYKILLGKFINLTKNKLSTHFSNISNFFFLQKKNAKSDKYINILHSSCYNLHKIKTNTLTTVEYSIISFFIKLGFSFKTSSEVDTSWFCFDALNIPPYHTSRNSSDTFYIQNRLIKFNPSDFIKQYGNKNSIYMMRTQTSSIQIKTLLSLKTPLKIITLGRVFRNDNVDSTHNINFSQIEILSVGVSINLKDLRDIIFKFLTSFFDKNKRIRFRNSYFPFTQPSFEVDIMDDFGN